ncbi:MAG: hypothetical protein V3U27_21415 [Candidatus Tectomicrobia bacterium]
MRLTVAFLWAVVIVSALLGMMALAEMGSQAIQPLSDVMIGEPMCIQPDGSVCPFLEDAK